MFLITCGLPGLGSVLRASLAGPLTTVSSRRGDLISNVALALEPQPSPAGEKHHPGFREHSFNQTGNSEIPVS